MANITQEARRLIERDNLGAPTEVYRTNALAGSIIGLIFIVFGSVWSLITFAMLNGFRFLIGQSALSPVDSGLSTGVDTFGIITSIFSIIFPLFGLLFVGIGLMTFVRAILNRNNQAVVCTDGVAYVTRESADAFRWEQVLMVFDKKSVSTRQNKDGGRSTRVHHKYAVHCHDGRRFVFDNSLSHVEDLAEKIEVEVARRRAIQLP